jgi:hypothetical protein
VSEARYITDILALRAGLRYGWTHNTEAFVYLGGIANHTRVQNIAGTNSISDQRFSDAWVGFNHRLSDENSTPALIITPKVAVLENNASQGTDVVKGKSASIGLTSYRTIAPLILSLTAEYRYSGSRKIGDQTVDPGDLIYLNPSVSFAVNNMVTLSSGLSWRWQKADRIDKQALDITTTRSDLEFGLGYSWSQSVSIQLNTRASVSGSDSIEVGLSLYWKL